MSIFPWLIDVLASAASIQNAIRGRSSNKIDPICKNLLDFIIHNINAIKP